MLRCVEVIWWQDVVSVQSRSFVHLRGYCIIRVLLSSQCTGQDSDRLVSGSDESFGRELLLVAWVWAMLLQVIGHAQKA